MQGFQSMIRELRSHMPHSVAKKKKKKHSFSGYELEIVYFLVGLVINILGVQVFVDLNFAIIILKLWKFIFVRYSVSAKLKWFTL